MLNVIENPTLDKAINQAIDKKLYETHTCIPGIIDSVDHTSKKVSVRLSIKRKYIDEVDPKELPIAQDIPLCTMQTASTIISLPVAKGDDCLVFFSERSLDIWKSNTATDTWKRIVDPKDPRKHHISDALCVPIAKPFGTGLTGDDTKIKIAHTENNVLTIDPNGHFKYVNSDGTILEVNGDEFKVTTPDNTVLKVDGQTCNITNASGANFSIDAAGKFELSNGGNSALSAISSFMGQAISAFSAINPVVFPPPAVGVQPNITAMTSAQSQLDGVKQ